MTLAEIGPILGLLGPIIALISLFLGAYFAWKSEVRKFRKDRITQAYTNFLDALAHGAGPRSTLAMVKMARGEKLDDAEMAIYEENNARYVNAHSNLVIHGSKEVIGALSKCYTVGMNFNNPEGRNALLGLVKAMRHDSEAEDYESYGDDVDNILISGPQRRQQAIAGDPTLFPPRGPAPNQPIAGEGAAR